MSVEEVAKELYLGLEKNGYKGRIVSIEHLQELQEEFEGQHREGLFDKVIYQEYLASFDFKISDIFPEARSLIIAAVPQPHIRVVFNWNGESIPLTIPPTYSHSTDDQVKKILEEQLGPKGHKLVKASLPLKLLAVRSGLAQYGKNNIAYIPDMGSFHRLAAFYTDFPGLEDNWGESQISERCEKCSACIKTCPTDAITSDRFLIRAERCITFQNENQGEFPKWIDPSWHNCLVGCLHCQKKCPMNKDFLETIEEKETFSQEETALFFEGAPREKIPDETIGKLRQLSMIEYIDVLGRNLSVLMV